MTQRQGAYDAAAWLMRYGPAHDVACPRCRAVAGAVCATPMGTPRAPHQERLTAAARRRAALAQLARWEQGLPPR